MWELVVAAVCILGPSSPLPSDFRLGLPSQLRAREGGTVELPCQVSGMENRTVSWLRGATMEILSAGRYTFTSDPRYTADYRQEQDTWLLRIRGLEARDGGSYECQLSGDPVLSHTVALTVTGPISEEPVSEARALQPAPQPSLPLKPKEGEEGGSQLQLLQLPQSSQSLGEGGGSLLLPVSCLALVLLCLLFLGALRSSREEEEGRGSRAGSRGSRSKRGHSDQEGQTDTTLPVLAYTEEGGVEWRGRGESDSLRM